MTRKLIDDITGYTFIWQKEEADPDLCLAFARKFNQELPGLSHTQASAIFKQILEFDAYVVVFGQ